MKALLPHIIDTIEKLTIKYEVHSFNSGATMIDIWINDKFYVIQIDGNEIGISLITPATISFDTIPDKIFKNTSEFKTAFEKIFSESPPTA